MRPVNKPHHKKSQLDYYQGATQYILDVQLPSGLIPWFKDSQADPWDHVESAMALSVVGEWQAAERAYQWLFDQQLDDGSWWAEYQKPPEKTDWRKETNFVAYIASGVWHHFLVTQSKEFLNKAWPYVQQAMSFVLNNQTEYGDIYWAVNSDGEPAQDALRTGCSSIYKSLLCAAFIAHELNQASFEKKYEAAAAKLFDTLHHRPERFDRSWSSKSRYSMDWFYPILTGVLTEEQARQQIESRWDEFIEEGLGCRCVSDEPWVTIAESCELVMALVSVGERQKAEQLFSWMHQFQFEDGSYWMGYQFIEKIYWPDQRPTWTTAAVILAADALYQFTPASGFFLGNKH